MFKLHSISGRIFVGKMIGLIAGAATLLLLPLISIETSLEFQIGFVLLMVVMGAMIGFIGIFKEHPLFPGIKMPWWLRGPSIGILFFLILVLLAKDDLEPFMSLDIITWTGLTSPYWAMLDGAILGGLMGYLITKICGEGNLPIK